ncbi:alkaline phosphatase family protein [Candidatus Woesearchaeota archaeon]|nr:alkaline phosphatase family protein [Candidatus Woesearchaeota archaeon]
MIIIFAIDALEYDKVKEFDCKNLMQKHFGKTDISEFSQPRTMVLWSSFMTGQNKEKELLAKGDEEMWNTKIPLEETFFSKFNNPAVIDLPGFNYEKEQHETERKMLEGFFNEKDKGKKMEIRKKFNDLCFKHHRKIKKDFFQALEEEEKHDFVLGYFSVADVIGHLNFGNRTMMKIIYKELNEVAGRIKDKGKLIILSDHGMKGLGMFGEHSEYGFWSTNFETDLKNPKITDFYEFIVGLK